jgi:peptidyl-prolyl cis-trans isomerase SurA
LSGRVFHPTTVFHLTTRCRPAVRAMAVRAMASRHVSLRTWLTLCVCSLLTLAVAAHPLPATADDAAQDAAAPSAIIVARINGTPVYRAIYEEVLRRAGHDAATTPQQRQQIAARVIEELINERLLGELLEENGVQVKSTEVDAMMASLRSQLAARQQTLDAFLSESGRDETVLRKQMATELGLNKLLVPLLTESRLQEYFDEHRQEFDGTRLRVSHIVLRPNSAAGSAADSNLFTQAAAIREQIVAGELTFSDAVRQHSAGQSRLRDGDLGFIPRHGLLHEAFATAAFRLSKGEVSEPFITPFGVHLATVTDVEAGRGGFAAARPEVQKQLASELVREMLAERRQAADVVYTPGIPHFVTPAGQPAGSSPEVVVEPAEKLPPGELFEPNGDGNAS